MAALFTIDPSAAMMTVIEARMVTMANTNLELTSKGPVSELSFQGLEISGVQVREAIESTVILVNPDDGPLSLVCRIREAKYDVFQLNHSTSLAGYIMK